MDDDEVAHLLAAAPRDAFDVRAHVLAPGSSEQADDARWGDAVLVLQHGSVELECSEGERHTFSRGSVLWLDGLPVRRIHNVGPDPAVIIAASRRTTSGDGRAPDADAPSPRPARRRPRS